MGNAMDMSATAQPSSLHEDSAKEPEGKRKRRPNIKYEGGEFTKGEELDASRNAGEPHQDEPASTVAQTLMHMSGGGADPNAAAAALQQQQQQYMMQQMQPQMMAMQQMQASMMMHPAWAQMMAPGAMQMPMQMDMSGGAAKPVTMDASSMYYPAMMMQQQGYGGYPATG